MARFGYRIAYFSFADQGKIKTEKNCNLRKPALVLKNYYYM